MLEGSTELSEDHTTVRQQPNIDELLRLRDEVLPRLKALNANVQAIVRGSLPLTVEVLDSQRALLDAIRERVAGGQP